MNYKFLVCILPVMSISFIMGGCTSDPYAPINQSTPSGRWIMRSIHQAAAITSAHAPAYPRHGDYASPWYSRY